MLLGGSALQGRSLRNVYVALWVTRGSNALSLAGTSGHYSNSEGIAILWLVKAMLSAWERGDIILVMAFFAG